MDVYSSETRDLLLDQKLPEVTGFSSTKTNVGNLQNSGFDLGLNATIISTDDFIWRSTFNVTYRQNKITTLGNDAVEQIDSEGNTVMKEPDDLQNGWFIGENKDMIWDFEADGVYQVGDEAEAANLMACSPVTSELWIRIMNGVINVDDKVFLGLRNNPWYITWRNDFEWKGFDLGVVFTSKA
jgi:hypothetical protein